MNGMQNQASSRDSYASEVVAADIKGQSRKKYRQLRLRLLTAMVAIAVIPMLMLAGLGYQQYRKLLRDVEQQQLERQLEGAIRSIEHMVGSLEKVVEFIAYRDRYDELLDDEALEDLLIRIHRQYGFFADLGVIDLSGIQKAYSGPYDQLVGVNYSEAEWFQQVIEQDVYISRVFTGHRQIPHFAVAVSHQDFKTNEGWILRATIHADKLQKYINTIKTDNTDDLFLVDDGGILQTSSVYYGETMDVFSTEVKDGTRHYSNTKGEKLSELIGAVENTPWSLVMLKRQYTHHPGWQTFANKLYFMVFICLAVSVSAVYFLVRALITLLSRADVMSMGMLKEAEHTEKLASIGRLAAGVGHEINNPLAIINQKTGLIEDLLHMSEDFPHKQTIEQSLKGINTSVYRCKAITHRLLGFARRTEVTCEMLDVNEVIREVLQFLDNSLLYNRIRLCMDLGENLPEVKSDESQLQQVFLNIINNGIDAIGKEGHITITSYLVAGDVRVVIQDDGPGMEEETLSHIFEPFYTTKEAGKGTGLGLSITYGLIKKLGGDITVRSQLGKGTAFTITIPSMGETDD